MVLGGQVVASKALKSCSQPARPQRPIPPRPTKQSGILRLFSNALAQSPKAPEALRKLAGLAQQQGKMQEAIGYYERVLAEYPDSGHGDEAQFMIAFIYEEYIRDLEKARRAYQRVIENYPDSELAASARHLLPNVGRTPQEWVQFQDEAAAP